MGDDSFDGNKPFPRQHIVGGHGMGEQVRGLQAGANKAYESLFARLAGYTVAQEGVVLVSGDIRLNFTGPGVSVTVDGTDPKQVNIFISGTAPATPGTGVGLGLAGQYSCFADVVLRDVVFQQSANVVAKADNDDPSAIPVIGFVISKPTPTSAIVQYSGELSGFSGLISGATYYLSTTPGLITATPPSTPGQFLQRVGFARNPSTLVVMLDRDAVGLT